MSGGSDKKQQQHEQAQRKTDASGVLIGEWDAGFCSCCSVCVPNCLTAWCLPCVSLAQVSSRLGSMTYGRALVFFLSLYVAILAAGVVSNYIIFSHLETVTADGNYTYEEAAGTTKVSAVVYALHGVADIAGIILVVSIWSLRSKTRERYQIQGNCCCDCLASIWCQLCVVTQMATHVKSYGSGCSLGPVDTLPPYQR